MRLSVLVGPALIIVSIYLWVTDSIDRSQLEETSGTVLYVDNTNYKNHMTRVQFVDLTGQTFIFTENTELTEYPVGKKVTVYYSTDKPDKAVLRRTVMKKQWGGMYFLLMGVFYSFALFVLRRVEDEENSEKTVT